MQDRYLYVLVRRLCTIPPVSQVKIGAELGGLTRQRIQQIEKRARKKAAMEGLTQTDLAKVDVAELRGRIGAHEISANTELHT